MRRSRGVALLVVVILGATGCNERSDRGATPPRSLGVFEGRVIEDPECQDDRGSWGCLDRGAALTVVLSRGGRRVAMIPTRRGASFRVELSPGRYTLSTPSSGALTPSEIGVGAGAVSRTDIVLNLKTE